MSPFYGLDACRKGWVRVGLETVGRTVVAALFPTISAALQGLPPHAEVLVDVPIGLPDGDVADEEERRRRADLEAKALLGRRASTVFLTPTRQAVYASDFAEAAALQRGATGVGLSRQAWGLVAKIREVDAWVIRNRGGHPVLRESHPELAWAMLNYRNPMRWPKADYLGAKERLEIASRHVDRAQVEQLLRHIVAQGGVRTDDVLDAMVLAIHARQGTAQGYVSLPGRTQRDQLGVRMEMVYASF